MLRIEFLFFVPNPRGSNNSSFEDSSLAIFAQSPPANHTFSLERSRLLPKSRRTTRNHRTARPPSHKTFPIIEEGAGGLFRWATTDHSWLRLALRDMPSMGFIDSLKYILCHLLILLVSAAVLWISMVVLLGYILPFVLVGVLTW